MVTVCQLKDLFDENKIGGDGGESGHPESESLPIVSAGLGSSPTCKVKSRVSRVAITMESKARRLVEGMSRSLNEGSTHPKSSRVDSKQRLASNRRKMTEAYWQDHLELQASVMGRGLERYHLCSNSQSQVVFYQHDPTQGT